MSQDDLSTENFDTDKVAYIRHYRSIFGPIRNNVKNMLELGIYHGGSLEMWRSYFPQATISGLDLDKIEVPNMDRLKIYQGDQADINLLKKITEESSEKSFDIIIDDASHFGRETFTSFIYLFKNSLKSGGIYVIEDWGTGYWYHFPDGRTLDLDAHHVSHHLHNDTDYKFQKRGFMDRGPFFNSRRFQGHDFGMVGVIKQIIDEVGIEAATNKYTGKTQQLESLIDKVTICDGLVFIYKK